MNTEQYNRNQIGLFVMDREVETSMRKYNTQIRFDLHMSNKQYVLRNNIDLYKSINYLEKNENDVDNSFQNNIDEIIYLI